MAKQEQKYRIGRNTRRKARKYLWLGILILLLIGLGVATYLIVRALEQGNTESAMPAPITREFAPPEIEDKTFDQAEFVITLPKDWRLKDHIENSMYNRYSFQATEANKDNRWLDVYVDRLPEDMAFNRLLPVKVEENTVIIMSSVSENCTAFTGTQGANRPSPTGAAKMDAKWQGVPFYCDMANYTRNVIGVGTEASGHKLELVGEKTGRHTFFVVYTDHNINPDYQILERALESLRAK